MNDDLSGYDENYLIFDDVFRVNVSISDVDNTSLHEVVLSVTNGTLTVKLDVTSGVTSASGNGTNSVTLSGTVAAINATLADAAGVTVGAMNEMFSPDGFEIVDHDGDDTNADERVTPDLLYGAGLDLDTVVIMNAIDTDSDGTVSDVEFTTARDINTGGYFTSLDEGGNVEINDGGGFMEFSHDGYLMEDMSGEKKLQFSFDGMGGDDQFKGGEANDTFYGAPGDDIFWGRGDEPANWWDIRNSGDQAGYHGIEARYTISSSATADVDSGNDGTWDNTKITYAEYNNWVVGTGVITISGVSNIDGGTALTISSDGGTTTSDLTEGVEWTKSSSVGSLCSTRGPEAFIRI